MDNDELIARLTAQRDAWWEAHDALDYWMTYDPIMGSPLEDDYVLALTRARSLMERIPSPAGSAD